MKAIEVAVAGNPAPGIAQAGAAMADAMGDCAESQTIHVSKVFAVGVGNALEFYDFLTFSFFAIQIGHCFFPATQKSHSLLYSLAAFGVGFLMRPIGSIVIGSYGDRVGRKPAMILSFSLMGAAILGLALTPGYARIGIAAPILLVIFRLTQGFALGGEVGPSTAFLVEAAPPSRRGFYVSVQYMTQDMAILLAGIVGFLLSRWLSPQAIDTWGWRVAFLLGTAVVPVGLYMRHGLPETMGEEDRRAARAAKHHVPVRIVLLGLMMLLSGTVFLYGLDYITTYVQDILHLSVGIAFAATVVVGFSAMVFDPLTGLLSDLLGRKPVMLTATVALLLLTVPLYMAMNRFHSVAVMLGAMAVLAVLEALFSGPALVTITESLPKAVRSGVLAVIYAVSISVFGGTTQFAVKFLTDLTHSPLATAWYMTGALIIGLIAMVLVEETAPVKAAAKNPLPADKRQATFDGLQ